MGYDSWKLASGDDARADRLADACSDAERFLQNQLESAVRHANDTSVARWDVREVFAEADDNDEIWIELSLRLSRIPAGARGANLHDLAASFINLGNYLSRLAQNERSGQLPLGMKMAPSVRSRSTGREADMG